MNRRPVILTDQCFRAQSNNGFGSKEMLSDVPPDNLLSTLS